MKHSLKGEVGCANPGDIFEDECLRSPPEASLLQEDPNHSLQESRTNAQPSVQVPTRKGLSTSEVAELSQGISVDNATSLS